ncbi:MAG: hypothetical protein EB015_17715 [Methylocystaceae bacterium]|nr:hypothetical protein [Methylocystaceae bacterium]
MDALGRSKTLSASLVLRDFDRRGWITLPERRKRAATVAKPWALPDADRLPSGPVTGSLQELGPLSLVQRLASAVGIATRLPFFARMLAIKLSRRRGLHGLERRFMREDNEPLI